MAQIFYTDDNGEIQTNIKSITESDRIQQVASEIKLLAKQDYTIALKKSLLSEQVIELADNLLKEHFSQLFKHLKQLESEYFDYSLSSNDLLFLDPDVKIEQRIQNINGNQFKSMVINISDDLRFRIRKDSLLDTDSMLTENTESVNSKITNLSKKYNNLYSNLQSKSILISSLKLTIQEYLNDFLTKIDNLKFRVKIVSSLDEIQNVDDYKNVLILVSENHDSYNSYSEYVYDYQNNEFLQVYSYKIDYDEFLDELLEKIQDIHIDDNQYSLQSKDSFINLDYITDITNNSESNVIAINTLKGKSSELNITVYDYLTRSPSHDGSIIYVNNTETSKLSLSDIELLVSVDKNLASFEYLNNTLQYTYTLKEKFSSAYNSIFYTFDYYDNRISINDLFSNGNAYIDFSLFNYRTYAQSHKSIYHVEDILTNSSYIRMLSDFGYYEYETERLIVQPNKGSLNNIDEFAFANDESSKSITVKSLDILVDQSRNFELTNHVKNKLTTLSTASSERLPSYTLYNYDTKKSSNHNVKYTESPFTEPKITKIVNKSNLPRYFNGILSKTLTNKFYTYYLGNTVKSNNLQVFSNVDYTNESYSEVFGYTIRNNIKLKSSFNGQSTHTISDISFSIPKYSVRYIRNVPLVTIKKFELRKNTNTRLNCNVTLNDKSNVYILSGEISTVRYTSFTSQNHDIKISLKIDNQNIDVKNGYFEFVFEPTDSLTLYSSTDLTIENIRIEKNNGISRYSYRQLFIDNFGFAKTNDYDTLYYRSLETKNFSDYVKVLDNTVYFYNRNKQITSRYHLNNDLYLSDITDYLKANNIYYQNVKSVTYDKDKGLALISFDNYNLNDPFVIDDSVLIFNDKTKELNSILNLDRSLIEDNQLLNENLTKINIELPNSYRYSTEIRLIPENSNLEYTSYKLQLGKYYKDNLEQIDYYDNTLKSYNPYISEISEEPSNNDTIDKTIRIRTIDNHEYNYNIYNQQIIGNYPIVSKSDSLIGYNIQTTPTDTPISLSETYAGQYLSSDTLTRLTLHNDLAISVMVFISYKLEYSNETITEYVTIQPNQFKIISNIYGVIWYTYKFGEMDDYKLVESESWRIIND